MTVSSCGGKKDAEQKLWFLSIITSSKYDFRLKNGAGISQLTVIVIKRPLAVELISSIMMHWNN